MRHLHKNAKSPTAMAGTEDLNSRLCKSENRRTGTGSAGQCDTAECKTIMAGCLISLEPPPTDLPQFEAPNFTIYMNFYVPTCTSLEISDSAMLGKTLLKAPPAEAPHEKIYDDKHSPKQPFVIHCSYKPQNLPNVEE